MFCVALCGVWCSSNPIMVRDLYLHSPKRAIFSFCTQKGEKWSRLYTSAVHRPCSAHVVVVDCPISTALVPRSTMIDEREGCEKPSCPSSLVCRGNHSLAEICFSNRRSSLLGLLAHHRRSQPALAKVHDKIIDQ